nr:ImmA/IrrE family metallo-endopeptidase [Spirochaetales bacterium]
ALYQKLSAPDAAKPSPMAWCLKPSYDSSYDEADDAAEWLIQEWELGKAPAHAMIYAAVKRMPTLRVFYIDPPEGISGAACRLTGLDVILINRNDNPARRNFDFAHELFHILTWDRMPPDRMDVEKPLNEKGRRAEKLANKFASRLLMPKSALQQQWEQREPNLPVAENLHHVGAFFQASAQAVYWRLVNDGLLHKKEVQDYRDLPDPDSSPEPCPPLYSKAYMERLSDGLQAGRLTVRKAGNILGLSIDELSGLFQEYDLKPPFEL